MRGKRVRGKGFKVNVVRKKSPRKGSPRKRSKRKGTHSLTTTLFYNLILFFMKSILLVADFCKTYQTVQPTFATAVSANENWL